MNSLTKIIAAVALATGVSVASAQAAPIIFKGTGLNATPDGNYVQDCGSIGVDYCSLDHDIGLLYSASGLEFAVKAYANGAAVRVIQDIDPAESGLGAFSETGEDQTDDDQTQYDSGESIEFIFSQAVILKNIEFNSGADKSCYHGNQPEGPCGFFDLYIDGVLAYEGLEAVDDLLMAFVGTTFRFVPITPGGGFVIAQFDVQAVPVPAALPLLLTGIAGLGFASRRKKRSV